MITINWIIVISIIGHMLRNHLLIRVISRYSTAFVHKSASVRE